MTTLELIELIGIVAAATITTVGTLAAGFLKWNRGMDERVAKIETRLDVGDKQFDHIGQRFEQVEQKIQQVSDRNQECFRSIERKIDTIVDHLLKEQ